MFIKASFLSLVAITSLSVSCARELIIERDGRPFYPRRFGQEQCGGIGGQIGSACAGNICGVLGGKVPGTLLAGAGACAQQDLADDIIDASKDQDAATAANMVALAVKFRQCEKNTPPDFSTNPPALRNSVFCDKAPKNAELDGLVQGQDPANDPNLFFDPATKATVKLGAQANTFAFGSSGGATAAGNKNGGAAASASVTRADGASGTCLPAKTVTVTAATVTSAASAPTADASGSADSATEDTTTDTGSSSNLRADTIDTGAIDFGTCTNPAVEFGPGFEGRKASEFSFEPEDKTEFAQSSALNGQIVFNAICNILNDKCKAPAATVTACRAGLATAASLSGGAKADAFNKALGITTNFANISAASGGGVGTAAAASAASFGSCGTPKIAFGIFDGRKENSFAPVGNDFQHGSALNPAIITKFVCDQLVNKCDANAVAISNCAAAITATNGLSGQAVVDAFNAAVAVNVA